MAKKVLDENREYIEQLSDDIHAMQSGIDKGDTILHIAAPGLEESTNSTLMNSFKAVPPIALALEGIGLIAETYLTLRDTAQSNTTKAGKIGAAIGQFALLGASIAMVAIASPAALAVYVGYCGFNAAKNIVSVANNLWYRNKPEKNIVKKNNKIDRIQSKIDALEKSHPTPNENVSKKIAKFEAQKADLESEVSILKDSLGANNKIEAQENFKAKQAKIAGAKSFDALTSTATAVGFGLLLVPSPPTMILGATILGVTAAVGITKTMVQSSYNSYKNWRYKEITKKEPGNDAMESEDGLLDRHLQSNNVKGNNFEERKATFLEGLDANSANTKMQKAVIKQYNQERKDDGLAPKGISRMVKGCNHTLKWIASGALFTPPKTKSWFLKGALGITKGLGGLVVAAVVGIPAALIAAPAAAVKGIRNKINGGASNITNKQEIAEDVHGVSNDAKYGDNPYLEQLKTQHSNTQHLEQQLNADLKHLSTEEIHDNVESAADEEAANDAVNKDEDEPALESNNGLDAASENQTQAEIDAENADPCLSESSGESSSDGDSDSDSDGEAPPSLNM